MIIQSLKLTFKLGMINLGGGIFVKPIQLSLFQHIIANARYAKIISCSVTVVNTGKCSQSRQFIKIEISNNFYFPYFLVFLSGICSLSGEVNSTKQRDLFYTALSFYYGNKF